MIRSNIYWLHAHLKTHSSHHGMRERESEATTHTHIILTSNHFKKSEINFSFSRWVKVFSSLRVRMCTKMGVMRQLTLSEAFRRLVGSNCKVMRVNPSQSVLLSKSLYLFFCLFLAFNTQNSPSTHTLCPGPTVHLQQITHSQKRKHRSKRILLLIFLSCLSSTSLYCLVWSFNVCCRITCSDR